MAATEEQTVHLGDLPAEILRMVVRELRRASRRDVMALHSVSKLWYELTEQLYSQRFYERVAIVLKPSGFQRLHNIAQDEICRKRVKCLSIAIWEREIEPDYLRRIYKLKPTVLCRLVCIMRRLEMCTCLEISANYPLDLQDSNFHSGLRSGLPQATIFFFLEHMMAAALLAVAEISRIETLKIYGRLIDGAEISPLPVGQGQPDLPHIKELVLKFIDHDISDGARDMPDEAANWLEPEAVRMLSSFLDRFPALKGLSLMTDTAPFPPLTASVIRDLTSICLEFMVLEVDQFTQLKEEAPLLKFVELRRIYVIAEQGYVLEAWTQAVKALLAHPELDELHLSDCSALHHLPEVAVRAGKLMKGRGQDDKLKLRNLKGREPNDTVQEFLSWVGDDLDG